MRCDEAQNQLQLGRAPEADAALREHVQSCARCGELWPRHDALNGLLALDEPHQPGPGFDTRFFARLGEERAAGQSRRRRLSLRMWLWALVPAAAGVALLVIKSNESAPLPEAHAPAVLIEALAEPDDLAMMEDLELLEDIEVVQQLDELEDLELLEDVEPAELERIAAEASP